MTQKPPRRVDDAYPVLKQWTFTAHERARAIEDSLNEFFIARDTYRAWREPMPTDRAWSVSMPPEGLRYEAAGYRVQGDSYFLLSATHHVVRILDADEHLGKLPRGLHDQIKNLRHVLEHWDEWTEDKMRNGGEAAAKRVREAHPDAWPFGMTFENDDFLVAGVIPLAALQEELQALWLWQISPPSNRNYPPPNMPSYPYPLEPR